MHDIMEQLGTYIRGIWRFRWYAMLVAWLVGLSGWAFVAQMPDQYEASARVYVDTDSLLRPLLKGLALQPDVENRVQLMTKTLLSRPNLEKLVRMTDLDIRAKTPEQMESILNGLAAGITFESSRRGGNLYTIRYRNRDPQLAKRVVQASLTIFVESTLGEGRQDASTAQKFLDQQISHYEKRLVKAENRLTQFRLKHRDVLQGGDFFSQLQEASAQLQQANLDLRAAERTREELQHQLEDAEDTEEDALGLYSNANLARTTSVDARIETLQSKLDELLLRYTDEHPDIQEIRRTVGSLEQQKHMELEAMGSSVFSNENPIVQQLQMSLSQANANLAAMRERVSEYQRRVDRLDQLVDTRPQVETEIKRLNRDYDVNKENYNILLSRRETAKLGEDVEQTGDDVQFRVVDPPRVPLSPSGPDRLMLSSFVFVGGLGAGIALAFLLSQIRPVVYNQRALQEVTGLPVFGAVSRIWTPEVLFKRRLEFGGFMVASTIFTCTFAGVMFLYTSDYGNPFELLKTMKGWL